LSVKLIYYLDLHEFRTKLNRRENEGKINLDNNNNNNNSPRSCTKNVKSLENSSNVNSEPKLEESDTKKSRFR